jgi:hypothetical protein
MEASAGRAIEDRHDVRIIERRTAATSARRHAGTPRGARLCRAT